MAQPFFARALSGVTVEPQMAELVIVRTSSLLRCTYCTLSHAAEALRADVTQRLQPGLRLLPH